MRYSLRCEPAKALPAPDSAVRIGNRAAAGPAPQGKVRNRSAAHPLLRIPGAKTAEAPEDRPVRRPGKDRGGG